MWSFLGAGTPYRAQSQPLFANEGTTEIFLSQIRIEMFECDFGAPFLSLNRTKRRKKSNKYYDFYALNLFRSTQNVNMYIQSNIEANILQTD